MAASYGSKGAPSGGAKGNYSIGSLTMGGYNPAVVGLLAKYIDDIVRDYVEMAITSLAVTGGMPGLEEYNPSASGGKSSYGKPGDYSSSSKPSGSYDGGSKIKSIDSMLTPSSNYSGIEKKVA
ncbi:MAG: hypothetical protein ACLFPQ_03175 [Candidatus Woesearchaeota archaeon]